MTQDDIGVAIDGMKARMAEAKDELPFRSLPTYEDLIHIVAEGMRHLMGLRSSEPVAEPVLASPPVLTIVPASEPPAAAAVPEDSSAVPLATDGIAGESAAPPPEPAPPPDPGAA